MSGHFCLRDWIAQKVHVHAIQFFAFTATSDIFGVAGILDRLARAGTSGEPNPDLQRFALSHA